MRASTAVDLLTAYLLRIRYRNIPLTFTNEDNANDGKNTDDREDDEKRKVGLAGILIIGSISVFLIHKRNNKNEYIGDEVIRASDMTIVE
jgi:hypothetical protein